MNAPAPVFERSSTFSSLGGNSIPPANTATTFSDEGQFWPTTRARMLPGITIYPDQKFMGCDVKIRKDVAVVFSDQIALERKSGAIELAEKQAEETKKRIAAHEASRKRLEELRSIADEEGYKISAASEKALKAFLAATSFTKRPYITLLDNGNVRAFWEDKAAGEQIGLQFLGGDHVQYVIFARRAGQGYIARSAGRDLVTNMESQIDGNGLRRLMT